MKAERVDTIAAISTPSGEGAIGVIRLSGPQAFRIGRKVFTSNSGKNFSELRPRYLYRGKIKAGGSILDEVVLAKMAAPNSYTGEAMVEIYAHGGRLILAKILEAVFNQGARQAQAGEFTKRAFLNGKIDLVQAESIAWMIKAHSELELKSALRQLQGEPSEFLKSAKKSLIKCLAQVEVSLDFSEYEGFEISFQKITRKLRKIAGQLNDIERRMELSVISRDGIRIAIAGKPNVGKSSLLNRFLEEKRAIVSREPGTTRDTIEEVIQLDGLPLRLIDTAGITEPRGEVEKEGVKRSIRKIRQAQLVLFILDSGTEITADDYRVIKLLRNKLALVVVNKTDLPSRISMEKISGYLRNRKVIEISAKKNWGVEKLKKEVGNIISNEYMGGEMSLVMLNPAHQARLKTARLAVERAITSARKRLSGEFVAIELKEALAGIKELLGEEYREEVLEAIFSNFCVGK